jgi:pimeloyl-ACP methyl ester carboxylesterase
VDRLHTIQVPTLVIAGTDDRLVNSGSSGDLTDAISNARQVKIGGGSHSCFVSRRGMFNREVLDSLLRS